MSRAQKVPTTRQLSAYTEQRARDVLAEGGLEWPCRVTAVAGSMVTVKFNVANVLAPDMTMPVAGFEYIRYPIEAGDGIVTGELGVAMSASAYLGALSGLGDAALGTADIQIPDGNLADLVFVPFSTKSWAATPDPTALVLYGRVGGVTVQNSVAPAFSIKVTSTGITLYAGTTAMLTVTAAGVTIQGQAFLAHTHLPGTFTAPSGGGPVTGDSGAVT